MAKIKITKKKITFLILLSLIIPALLFDFSVQRTSASDCDLLEGDEKKKCEKLEEKAEAYQKVIDLKSKQGDLLSGQINNINGQKVSTQKKIGDLASEIENLERNISEKEKEIRYKKEILKGLIQLDAENSQAGVKELSVLSSSLGANFVQSDRIGQSGTRMTELVQDIETAKTEMEKDKKESEEKKGDLEDKKDDLASLQNQKQSLLVATQGEEDKYRQLLEKVEQQKQELFDFSSFGSYSISDKDRPKDKDKLSNSWYYAQGDSRWKSKEIGDGSISGYTMENWGCAVSAVSMMKTYYGSRTTPKDILKQPSKNFYGLDIRWSATLGSYRDTGYGYYNYKSLLNDILDDGDIAIIHVKFARGGHFLVVGGKDKEDYIVHDPYFGSNIYLRATLKMLNARVDRVIYK